MDFDVELTDCTFTTFLQRDRWRVTFPHPVALERDVEESDKMIC